MEVLQNLKDMTDDEIKSARASILGHGDEIGVAFSTWKSNVRKDIEAGKMFLVKHSDGSLYFHVDNN